MYQVSKLLNIILQITVQVPRILRHVSTSMIRPTKTLKLSCIDIIHFQQVKCLSESSENVSLIAILKVCV